MIKVKILSIRKNTDLHVQTLESQWIKRLKPHIRFELQDIRQSYSHQLKKSEILLKEAELFEKKISPEDHCVALDKSGKSYSSVEFEKWFSQISQTPRLNLVLLIGGPYGLHERILKQAKSTISLSKMTLSHEYARLFLIEQIYRAIDIANHGNYHK